MNFTKLMRHFDNGKMKAVKQHIAANIHLLDETDNSGLNLLHIAAQTGNLEAIKFLLDKHPNPGDYINTTHSYGWYALHIAIQEGCLDVAEFLLKKYPNLNTTCKSWNSFMLFLKSLSF